MASAEGASDQAQRDAQPDRPLEQDDVSQTFQKPERAEVDLRSLGVGEEEDGDVGPGGLGSEATHQRVDGGVFERFFGEQNRRGSAEELLAQLDGLSHTELQNVLQRVLDGKAADGNPTNGSGVA